jgi:glycosyltransferase involved in cell wall biosynthesis
LNFKILFIYQYFGTPNGSWSTRVYELTRRWVQEGYQVEVITSPYEKSDLKVSRFIERQSIEGINLTIINTADSNRKSILKRVVNALLFSFVSIWYTLTKKYDVIIVSSGPITVGLPMLAAKILRRKKTVFEVRDLWPDGAIEMGLLKSKVLIWLAKKFELSCYNHANLVVTASVGQFEMIKNHENKIVIPNASSLQISANEQFDFKDKFPFNKYLLHIGSLGLIHHIPFWIDVAHAYQKRYDHELQFIFIGEGKDKDEYINYCQKIQLRNIHFLPSMPKKDLVQYVVKSQATLFATTPNPVQDTCCPNKIFDSMNLGKPIIQTSKGWIFELVNSYQIGLNITLNSPNDSAEMIHSYINSNDMLRDHGVNAKELSSSQFNLDILAQQYLNALLQLK